MSETPTKFLDSLGQIKKEASEKLVEAGVDRGLAAEIIRDATKIASGYIDPQHPAFQKKYENLQNILEIFQSIAVENKPFNPASEDLKDYHVSYEYVEETTIKIPEKLDNDKASVIDLAGEEITPEAARPTAPETITTKKNPDKPNSTPPDNVTGSFTTAVDAKSIGAMLSEARNEAGITKVAAAQALGKDEKTIRNLEKGQHNSTLPRIQEYADILGYDLEFRLVPRDNS